MQANAIRNRLIKIGKFIDIKRQILQFLQVSHRVRKRSNLVVPKFNFHKRYTISNFLADLLYQIVVKVKLDQLGKIFDRRRNGTKGV